MASAASIASVGASFGYIFGPVEMARAGAAFARTAKYLYIVYEIGVSHTFRVMSEK